MILHYGMSGFPDSAGQAVQLNPEFSTKGFENRIVLIMRVNPDVRIVSMVSVNH